MPKVELSSSIIDQPLNLPVLFQDSRRKCRSPPPVVETDFPPQNRKRCRSKYRIPLNSVPPQPQSVQFFRWESSAPSGVIIEKIVGDHCRGSDVSQYSVVDILGDRVANQRTNRRSAKANSTVFFLKCCFEPGSSGRWKSGQYPTAECCVLHDGVAYPWRICPRASLASTRRLPAPMRLVIWQSETLISYRRR